MRFLNIVLSLVLCSMILFFSGQAFAEKISDKEQSRLSNFIKKRMGSRLPAGAKVEVKGFEKSPIKGLKEGEFVIESPRGSGQVPFLISDDGKYVIFGAPVDLAQFKDSEIGSLKKGEVSVGGRQSVPVFISNDGKYLIAGELIDSTIDPSKEIMKKISLDGVPRRGDKNAKITIVEYSDFQCPFCARAHSMLPEIMEDYKGKVNLVYKQLPLRNHNWAKGAAIASVCAGEQGNEKFWEFHDMVFENQRNISLDKSNDQFRDFAKQIGLNTGKFDKCLSSPEVALRIENDVKEANTIGVRSTPTFVVNGMIVPGANPQGLRSAIETNLSEE